MAASAYSSDFNRRLSHEYRWRCFETDKNRIHIQILYWYLHMFLLNKPGKQQFGKKISVLL
jgi:hypothetical protein